MTKKKRFFIPKEQIKELIGSIGACFASDKITVEGLSVRYMFREAPAFVEDSGWRFFSGAETLEYVDDPENLMIFDVNTIANNDQSIIPYLTMPVGSELERLADTLFVIN